MTYDLSRILDARIPETVNELYLDTCAYEYGKSVTNLLTYSEQFDHANWTKINSPTITTDVETAPDGTRSMDNISDTSTTLWQPIQQVFSPFVSVYFYNISLFIEKDNIPRTTRYIFLRLQFSGSTTESNDFKFDTKTGEFSTTTSSTIGIYGVVDEGNYWRVYISAKSADVANTTGSFTFYSAGGASDIWAYDATITGSADIWGAQVTAGSGLKHYVRAEAASTTGSCDAVAAKANRLIYSEQFDDTAWTDPLSEWSVIASNAIAPDGLLTADTITVNAGDNSSLIRQNVTLTTGDTYTFSVWIKFRSGTITAISVDAGNGSSVSILSQIGNEWARITATVICGAFDWLDIQVNFSGASASFDIWGAQLVEGSQAGIYYKTEATAFSGTVGAECYNTFLTCQDTANFTKHSKTYRLYQPVSNWPIGQTGYPCIKGKPTFTPCEIDPKGSFGKRGVVSFKCEDFADDDLFTDNYQSTRTYNPELQGTFFRKLKARSPYYKGRLMKVRQGYINSPFSFDDFEDRLYVIESIDIDQKGIVTITGKDLLKLADDKKSVAPVASNGTLSAAMTDVQTTAVLQTGEGVDYDTDPYTGSAISSSILGYALIGDELVSFTGVSIDTPTGLTRGLQGTTATAHDINDAVQLCLHFEGVNVVDIIHYLLKTGAGISETYLPYDAGLTTPTGIDDEWDGEKGSWLSGNILTHTVIKPTGVTKLVERICKQNLIYQWFHERDHEVKLRAIAPTNRNELPPTLTEASNLIADSIRVKDMDKNRISQIHVYYDQIDVTGNIDDVSNYKKRKIVVDTDSENVNAYSEKAIKVIYADWLGSANEGLILTLAGRLLSRYAGRPENITFKIDTKDADFWTGNLALLDSFNFQDVDGSNKLKKIQIMKVKDDHDNQIIEVTAESWDYSDNRYQFITPNSMGDYTAESELNQQSYGFICQNDGLYTNNDIGHLIA